MMTHRYIFQLVGHVMTTLVLFGLMSVVGVSGIIFQSTLTGTLYSDAVCSYQIGPFIGTTHQVPNTTDLIEDCVPLSNLPEYQVKTFCLPASPTTAGAWSIITYEQASGTCQNQYIGAAANFSSAPSYTDCVVLNPGILYVKFSNCTATGIRHDPTSSSSSTGSSSSDSSSSTGSESGSSHLTISSLIICTLVYANQQAKNIV